MIKVKKGDKLVCIEDEGQRIVKKGKVYTVRQVVDHRVYIEEHKRFSYLIERFRLANKDDL